jgi:hypothetical protein
MAHSQLELMRRFIVQEAHACMDANPEMMTILGPDLMDWLHPQPDSIGGVYIATMGDGRKQTVLVCRPRPEIEPTVIQFWEGDWVSEHKAVYLCPNAVIVMRPTEKSDESWLEKENIQ